MKVEHKYTLLKFCIGDDEWTVICFNSKRGENVFRVYRGREFITNYQPMGCHVNKSTAGRIIKKIAEKYYE